MTEIDPFDSPASYNPEDPRVTEYENHLLLFEVTEHKHGVQTKNGEKDAIIADVVVFSETGDVVNQMSGSMIFQNRLIGKLKRNINGKPVLGVLVRDPKGQNNPWDLRVADKKQQSAVKKYLSDRAAESEDPFAV